MITFYTKDIVYILIVAVCFSMLAVVHRTLLPSKYSSVLQMEEDEKKTLQSTVIRILYVLLGTLFFYKVLRFTKIQIVSGVFVASFLNVWSAIVQHHLLKFFKSKERWMLLFRYILFVIVSVLISIFTIDKFILLLRGDESIYFLENQGVSLLLWMLMLLIPISGEQLIVKYSKVLVAVSIDTFREEVYIVQAQLRDRDLFDIKNQYVIDEMARRYDISVEWLRIILKMERYYRENTWNKIAERMICCIFPNNAIKKDISVGAAQIRISTAQKLLRQNPESFVKKMWKDEYNIELCAQYIRYLIDEYYMLKRNGEEWCLSNYQDIFDYVACKYLGGEFGGKVQSVLVYSAVLRSALEQGIYYEGSEGVEHYYIHIFADYDVEKAVYEKMKEVAENYGKVIKDVYAGDAGTELVLYCKDNYMIGTIRSTAEEYGFRIKIERAV